MIEVEKNYFEFSGTTCYFVKGTNIRHREDGPALEYEDGYKAWYSNGKLHREDGPAVINPNGILQWYRHGKLHREDGPALIWEDGCKEWYINGYRHRDDGPALILADGRIFWYLNDICFDKKEEWFEALTEEQKEKALHCEYFIGS